MIVHNRLAEQETGKDYTVLEASSKLLLRYTTQEHKKIWGTDLCKCMNAHPSKNFTCTPIFKSCLLHNIESFLFVIMSFQQLHSAEMSKLLLCFEGSYFFLCNSSCFHSVPSPFCQKKSFPASFLLKSTSICHSFHITEKN